MQLTLAPDLSRRPHGHAYIQNSNFEKELKSEINNIAEQDTLDRNKKITNADDIYKWKGVRYIISQDKRTNYTAK